MPTHAEDVQPRPEYPRPDRDRSARWLNLNGTWEFRADQTVTNIVVPFAWETSASTVQRTWLEHGTYERSIVVPISWEGSRVVLCFGAVHYRTCVLIDGRVIGEHVGGYTPFEFDITDHLQLGVPAQLVVEVDAPADKRSIPHGKQRSIPRDDYDGVSFTPTSGIWQTVWLEAQGRTYPQEVSVRGDSLTGIDITGTLVGDDPSGADICIRVIEGSESISLTSDGDSGFSGRIELDQPHLWSPADPYLYRIEITTGKGDGADRVIVTTGLRRIETKGEEIRLNGERLYVRGVLDQGYWPGSGATAPSDDALKRDLELARSFGYNMVRKHIKLEDPRWLHHADKMGMLVWEEPPGPSRFSAQSAANFESQLAPMVARDESHPSIIFWGLYNEEWGLDWDIPGSPERAHAARHAYDTLKSLDDTRPIIDNSGWAHVRTDLVDWHYYDEDPSAWAVTLQELASGAREDFPVKLGPDFVVDKSLYGSGEHPRSGLPILNSEYGGGFTSLERAWHLRWQTQELRRHTRFSGYVYTELTDVEHEMAGLVNIYRQAKDLGGLQPKDVNTDTVIIIDLVPCHAGADLPVPEQDLNLLCHVAHSGGKPIRGILHAAWTVAGRPFPLVSPPPDAAADVNVVPFILSQSVTLSVPPSEGPARLLIWLVDQDGNICARTFVDVGPIEAPNRRGSRSAKPGLGAARV